MKRICCFLLAVLLFWPGGVLTESASALPETEPADAGKEIRILFVGNSLTQDGIAYLPYLLRTYYPDVRFTFCIWYNGRYTLAQQAVVFRRNDTCKTFSVAENTASWTNATYARKMSDILAEYSFDVICMQEYFNDRTAFTEKDLAGWNSCEEYIRSRCRGENEPEFISLFHAPHRNRADRIFELTRTGNALILQKTSARDMIPNGMAVYRALSTELDSLGDRKHLSADGLHSQEGIPCLLEAYTTLYWLLDRLGTERSAEDGSFRMTKEIYETLNVPGAHPGSGVITGTDEENLLAREIADQAFQEGKAFTGENRR